MKKNKFFKYIILITFFLIELISISLIMKSFSNTEISEIKQVNKVDKKKFAMYIEESDGNYVESLSSLWPTGNYILNTEKTTCVDANGTEVKGILSYNDGIIYLNSKKTVFCNVYFDDTSICKIASDSTKVKGEYGAKYNCKVDPNKPEYTFYLLDNNEDGTSDLIMNANINASGETVIPGVTTDTGLIKWYADERKNIHGPVTAMEYLHNATKSWSNVEPINYTYNDSKYQSFTSINGVATITKGDSAGTQVTIGSETEPIRSRMPIYSESDASITEVAFKNDTNAYLYENISSSKPNGYWTLSSCADGSFDAWAVIFGGGVYEDYVDFADSFGVRPVITVKIN